MRCLHFLSILSCLAVTVLPVQARDNLAHGGNAIIPLFSLQHEALEPDTEVELLACVTNANPRSDRELSPGDTFSFVFRSGLLIDCSGASAFSPGGDFLDTDFECNLDGDSLSISYVAEDATTWPVGDMACAALTYQPGSRSSTVLTEAEVGHRGSFAAPQPAVLTLSVAPDLALQGPVGPVGPAGPVGPTGPQGPPGPALAGERLQEVTTDSVFVEECEDPKLVPGLSIEFNAVDGSSILVQADLAAEGCQVDGTIPASLQLRVDGETVAERITLLVSRGSLAGSSNMSWLSAPLSAGLHQVEVYIGYSATPQGACDLATQCVGSPDPGPLQGRLIVVELLAE